MIDERLQLLLAIRLYKPAEGNPHAHAGMKTHRCASHADFLVVDFNCQHDCLMGGQRREGVDVTSAVRNIGKRSPETSIRFFHLDANAGVAGIARMPALLLILNCHNQYSYSLIPWLQNIVPLPGPERRITLEQGSNVQTDAVLAHRPL